MLNSLWMHRINTWNAQSLEIYCWLQHIKDLWQKHSLTQKHPPLQWAGLIQEGRRGGKCLVVVRQMRHRAQSGSLCPCHSAVPWAGCLHTSETTHSFRGPCRTGSMSLHSVLCWLQCWPSLLKSSWVSPCSSPPVSFFWESIRSCLCFEEWFLEGRLDLEPGWDKVPFPKSRTGQENDDCSPKSWWRAWTVLLITKTCGDLGNRTNLYCRGLFWAGRSITDFHWTIHPGLPK